MPARWTPDGPLDLTEPAHLRDARGYSPSLRRYAPPPELADLVRRFWVPVWDLPAGEESVQRVLQYPVCQVVVGPGGGELVGPHSGLNVQTLTGRGWVVGAMMQPAAGLALAGGTTVAELTNARRDLAEVAALDGPGLLAAVRAVIGADPAEVDRQREACALVAEALAVLLPVDDEGRLVNAIVEYVEGDREVHRVGQVCAKFDLGERALQRLLRRRIGLSPKWLIQRRRLHDAADRLRSSGVSVARVATELGYADQAHFTRDFRTVTGLTPGEFVAEPEPGA